jgi:protein ImuB
VEIIEPRCQSAAIAAMPISLLRLDDRVVAGLQRVGLRNVESILNLPRADLTARFGPSPGRQLDRALGREAEPIIWQQRPHPWHEHQPFVEPISTPENLAEAVARLSSGLCGRLEAAGMGGLRFTARFMRVDSTSQELTLATARPLQQAARLTKLLTDQFSQIDPGFGVEAMTLEADELTSLTQIQPTLDASPMAEDLAELIDTMVNSYKVMRIWRPIPLASHVPERATGGAAPFQTAAAWNSPPGLRPIRLISPPEHIEAVAPTPDNPPLLFRWRKAVHRVRAASGPERIAAEWWRRSDADERFRDYYRVEDQSGARFWLFRTSLPGEERPVRWYLHGVFG